MKIFSSGLKERPHVLFSQFVNLERMHSTQGKLSVVKDSERRGSRSNLANIGIHVQDRRNSRNAMEKQVLACAKKRFI